VLTSAERVERLCVESYASLYESDDAVLASLGHVWRRVGELATIDPQFQPYLDARDTIKSQLEDLAVFLRRYVDQIDASPAKLQHVEERLALLERLKRKFGPSLGDVVARRAVPDGMRAAGIVGDHPADGAPGGRGGVGREMQAARGEMPIEPRRHDARSHTHSPGGRVDLADGADAFRCPVCRRPRRVVVDR
jgi:hypothetical protein